MSQSILKKIVVYIPGDFVQGTMTYSAPLTHHLPEGADRWEVHQESGQVQFMAVNNAGEVVQFQVYAPGQWTRWEGHA